MPTKRSSKPTTRGTDTVSSTSSSNSAESTAEESSCLFRDRSLRKEYAYLALTSASGKRKEETDPKEDIKIVLLLPLESGTSSGTQNALSHGHHMVLSRNRHGKTKLHHISERSHCRFLPVKKCTTTRYTEEDAERQDWKDIHGDDDEEWAYSALQTILDIDIPSDKCVAFVGELKRWSSSR